MGFDIAKVVVDLMVVGILTIDIIVNKKLIKRIEKLEKLEDKE